MSVIVRGMEIPTNCFYCPLSVLSGERLFCEVTKDEVVRAKRSSDCPLVPVPPHGRLIDESDAITALLCDNDYAATLTVRNLPTIIPAEEDTQKDGGQDEAPAGPYDLLYEEGGANTT